MSSDTWNQLQAHKRKQENLKERLLKRRKERQGLLDGEVANVLSSEGSVTSSSSTKIVEGKLICFYSYEVFTV